MDQIIEKYFNELNNNGITKKDTDIIKFDAMGDDDIKKYFPFGNSRIILVSDLSKYKTIEKLLPTDKSHIFLLYQNSPNMGHWVLLSRYGNTIEYFDSYGGYIDHPYTWTDLKTRKMLGEGVPYLTILLKDTPYDVIWNGFDFQDKKNMKISTCGRHCVFRLKTILNNNLGLNDYIKMMKKLKIKSKLSYDEIVSDFINK